MSDNTTDDKASTALENAYFDAYWDEMMAGSDHRIITGYQPLAPKIPPSDSSLPAPKAEIYTPFRPDPAQRAAEIRHAYAKRPDYSA